MVSVRDCCVGGGTTNKSRQVLYEATYLVYRLSVAGERDSIASGNNTDHPRGAPADVE